MARQSLWRDDPIGLVEAAHANTGDDASWLRGIADSSQSIDGGFGVAAHRFDAGFAGDYPETAAVVDSAGRLLLDGAEEFDAPTSRTRPAAAAREVEATRGRPRRTEPNEAVDLWRELVAGEWALVDSVERDGKRLILARRNGANVREPTALRPRERQVAAYAALGHSIKFIAFELGLASSTVSSHLERAMRKLGCRSRGELVQVIGGSTESAARGRTA